MQGLLVAVKAVVLDDQVLVVYLGTLLDEMEQF